MKNYMHRREFSQELARRTGLSMADASLAVSAFLEIMTDTWIEKRPVCFDGFGIFDIRPTSERVGRNPKSMEEAVIPAGYKPVFKVSKGLKSSVNEQIRMRDSQTGEVSGSDVCEPGGSGRTAEPEGE